ncbi:GtrA family protein [Nocardioides mangrovicus]|uniref:GtrA family protein n=1 Tax=Nocardioides mangrovicus TaxID=2478913 RepID=A0A3L8P2B6_9ACTN|nr:GtrA family protein [Nocardioides mangrovicus]RLV49092.1 GtrA family protein [Nocardioides mangrovicus]
MTRLVARFGAVGILAFLVDTGVFNLMRLVVGAGPLTSKTISVIVATTVAYLGNRAWTFEGRTRHRVAREYVLFFAFNGIGLLISLACLGLSSYVLGLRDPVAENISSNVVGLGLGTLFRLWAYQRWVFPHVEPSTDPEYADASHDEVPLPTGPTSWEVAVHHATMVNGHGRDHHDRPYR